MSTNTLDALWQTKVNHETLAMQAIVLLEAAGFNLLLGHDGNAHYATPDASVAIHARLNDESRYDIISITSPSEAPMFLSVPPPPSHEQPSSATGREPPPTWTPSFHAAS
jgi:hypothetical protein